MPPNRTDPRARSKNIVTKQAPLPPNPIAGLKVSDQLRKRTISMIEEDDIQQEDIEQDDDSKEDDSYPPFHLHGNYSVYQEDEEEEYDDNDVDSRSHQIRPIGRKIIGQASSFS